MARARARGIFMHNATPDRRVDHDIKLGCSLSNFWTNSGCRARTRERTARSRAAVPSLATIGSSIARIRRGLPRLQRGFFIVHVRIITRTVSGLCRACPRIISTRDVPSRAARSSRRAGSFARFVADKSGPRPISLREANCFARGLRAQPPIMTSS